MGFLNVAQLLLQPSNAVKFILVSIVVSFLERSTLINVSGLLNVLAEPNLLQLWVELKIFERTSSVMVLIKIPSLNTPNYLLNT